MATLKRIIAAGRTAGTTLVGNQHAERFAALGVRFLAATAQLWLAAGMGELRQQVAAAVRGRSRAVRRRSRRARARALTAASSGSGRRMLTRAAFRSSSNRTGLDCERS
jgi:hypothetical protein